MTIEQGRPNTGNPGASRTARPAIRGRTWLTPALAFFVISCGSSAPAADPADTGSAPVRLYPVGAAAADVERSATGIVRLRRETPLAFVDAGRIAAIPVRAGDREATGQLLARLDASAIDAAASAASADNARAQAELRRQQTLLQQGWVAKARVETAAAAAQATSAALEARRFSQRFSTIRAPSSGIILERRAEPGQTVAAGTPVLLLGETSSGYVVQVGLGAADAGGLNAGAIADISFSDGAVPAMRGTLVELSGRADPGTGTFRAEFALPAQASLRSGQIAELRWKRPVASGATQALTVPASALFAARAGEAFVWRFDPKTSAVSARMVRIGAPGDRGVPVLSGLAPGDQIVAGGVDRLVEGQRVTAVADRA